MGLATGGRSGAGVGTGLATGGLSGISGSTGLALGTAGAGAVSSTMRGLGGVSCATPVNGATQQSIPAKTRLAEATVNMGAAVAEILEVIDCGDRGMH